MTVCEVKAEDSGGSLLRIFSKKWLIVHTGCTLVAIGHLL